MYQQIYDINDDIHSAVSILLNALELWHYMAHPSMISFIESQYC